MPQHFKFKAPAPKRYKGEDPILNNVQNMIDIMNEGEIIESDESMEEGGRVKYGIKAIYKGFTVMPMEHYNPIQPDKKHRAFAIMADSDNRELVRFDSDWSLSSREALNQVYKYIDLYRRGNSENRIKIIKGMYQ